MMQRIRIRPARWGVALTVLGATGMSVALLAPALVQSPTPIPGVLFLSANTQSLQGIQTPADPARTQGFLPGGGPLPPAEQRTPSPRATGAGAAPTPAGPWPEAPVGAGTASASTSLASNLPRPATAAATPASTPLPALAATPKPTIAPAPTSPAASAPVVVVAPDRPVVSGDDGRSDNSWQPDRAPQGGETPETYQSSNRGADG